MDHYFKSHGYLPEGTITNTQGQTLDIAAMPAILRTLLVTDGTVTKTLEAYFWEPVSVTNLKQDEIIAAKAMDFLECPQGEPLLDRRISLLGQSSKTLYAHAHSLIRLEMLPKAICADLKAGLIGIGEILRETGLETYRELVDLGAESTNDINKLGQNTQTIYRSYRIMIAHKPVILVTEKFPCSVYSA